MTMRNVSTECLTTQFQAGQSTYFFDIKEATNGSKYLKITESKVETDAFKRHQIMVFEEDLPAFKDAFKNIYQQLFPQRVENNFVKEIRKIHVHAYKKWTKSEENCLMLLQADGLNISEIAIEMGQQIGGIRSRLKKLGLK